MKKKKNRIGVWFSCNFSGFLTIGTYIVTYGGGEKSCCQWCRFSYLWCYCLWCNLVTKSKSSCQWCTLVFGAVTAVKTLIRRRVLWCLIWACTVCQGPKNWTLGMKWAATWQKQQCGCASSEDTDQPGHPPSLIRVFAFSIKKHWVFSYPLRAQRRLWSDWVDAQADLSLRWAQLILLVLSCRGSNVFIW